MAIHNSELEKAGFYDINVIDEGQTVLSRYKFGNPGAEFELECIFHRPIEQMVLYKIHGAAIQDKKEIIGTGIVKNIVQVRTLLKRSIDTLIYDGKPIFTQYELQAQVEFSGGSYYMRYQMSPEIAFVAFEIVKDSLQDKIKGNARKTGKARMTATELRVHAQAASLTQAIAEELAGHIHKELSLKTQSNIVDAQGNKM